jgi:hypothetical protein
MADDSERGPRLHVLLPADAIMGEFAEPVRLDNPDGSSFTLDGWAVWDAAGREDEPVDECEGAP